MQTLTITTARQNLGGWLEKAVRGEEIGVIVGNKIVAFRPVPVTAADYMESEYGFTTAEATASAARIAKAVASEEVVAYTPGMLTNENRTHKTVSLRNKKAKSARGKSR